MLVYCTHISLKSHKNKTFVTICYYSLLVLCIQNDICVYFHIASFYTNIYMNACLYILVVLSTVVLAYAEELLCLLDISAFSLF